ncbi:hypothetical protein [Dyella japonica]|uniref:Lipoprotein n=1 Tax=Dyella japonica TaxID=231455 RepID=A0ABV2K1E5_9GAMM
MGYLRKNRYVTSVFIVVIAACSYKSKDWPEPPLNATPKDRQVVSITTEDGTPVPAVVTARYGNPAKECLAPKVAGRRGRDYPHASITIQSEANIFPIYLDRYENAGPCPWNVMDVSVRLLGTDGQVAITGGMSSLAFYSGYHFEWFCDLKRPGVNQCMRGSVPGWTKIIISVR